MVAHVDAARARRRPAAAMTADVSPLIRPPAAPPAPPGARNWCIITCEYPPLRGGVSDHTCLLAEALAGAGDTVTVWAPPAAGPPPSQTGVAVRVLPSLFGATALWRLHHELTVLPPTTRVLVQYVPTGFGWRMMNLPFALLLFAHRGRGLDVYVHEIGFPVHSEDSVRRRAAGVVHRVMTWLVARSAARLYVAIPEWERLLAPAATRARVAWVPVPSNVPDRPEVGRVRALRRELLAGGAETVIAHFGTFGRYHSALLSATLPLVLEGAPRRRVLLVGRNSTHFRERFTAAHPEMADRVRATGGLPGDEVAAHIAAADVLLQPYEDGVSARRGSLMAALALGRAVVTNRGPVTGAFWEDRPGVLLADDDSPTSLLVALESILGDPERRLALAAAGRELYDEVFRLDRGVAVLRGTAGSPLDLEEQRSVALAMVRADRVPDDAAAPVTSFPRVLMWHTTLPAPGRKLGGVEVAVHRLANALVALGVPVTVASVSPCPADARYAHRRVHHRFAWLGQTTIGRVLVLPWLLNGLRVSGVDLVHFHGDDWFVFWRPRPTVRTLHGSALREAQRATRWPRRFMQYLVYPLERLAGRLATVTVAVGEDAAALHGVRRVIGNGVAPQQFYPGPKSLTPVVLYVGTWEGRKRGRWLHDLFVTRVLPRFPDAELHFITDVEPPPHPRVRYERFPDDAELARAYRKAWVFALPSTYEGFGIPYLEAMASGTVVLATPNAGAREVLGNGRFGVLADDAAFAEALVRLLEDEPTRLRIAAAGLERARAFDWGHVARGYLQVYDDALRLRRGFRPAAEDSAAIGAEGVVRHLPVAPPDVRRVRTGAFRGLTLERAERWSARARQRALRQLFVRLLDGVAGYVDVGIGDGAFTLAALRSRAVRQVDVFEPDRTARQRLARLLAPNGVAGDPRLGVHDVAVGAEASAGTTSLDALLGELRWPLLLRLAPESTLAALAGADRLLAQDSTRWLVGVTAETRAEVEARLAHAGLRVRLLRSGRRRDRALWLAAWRAEEGLPR